MGLRTIAVIGTLVLDLLAAPLPAEPQQAGKVYRMVVLSTRGLRTSPRFEAFRQALRDRGYIEGQNLVIEWLSTRKKKPQALADELVRLQVDALFAASMRAARAAKNASRTIPIVFASSPDPVAVGLVDSLARPGGNLTGVTHFSTALAGKRLELLKETIPELSRVAVLWQAGNPGSERIWKETQLRAGELDLQLHSMEVSSNDQFEGAFQKATKTGSTALVGTLSSLINRNRKQIADLAIKNRLPAIYADSRFVRAGGLMSYATDRFEQDRHAATYIDKLFKGAKPGDLPVMQPTKFDLIIYQPENSQAARHHHSVVRPVSGR